MKNKFWIRMFVIFVTVSIFMMSCGVIEEEDSFVYTTYNVGLAPTFVPLTDERLEPLKNAISNHEADAICLQEVWLPEHVEAIRTAAKDWFPYSYSVPPEQKYTDEAACTEMEISPLVSCIENRCPSMTVVDALCVLANCSVELNNLQVQNPVCAGAVISQVGHPLDEAIAAATKPAALFAFDGSNGLLLLSRYPLQDTQFIDFVDKSTTNHRVALFATIEIDGKHHILGCTHLTANLKDVPYTGSFSSWEEENYSQAADIISFHKKTYSYGTFNPHLIYLAGDFNCSMANNATGVIGDFEDSCQQFRDAGYFSPGMDKLGCSFCEDNLLNMSKGEGEGNLLLDHVFIKYPLDTDLPTQVETVFNNVIEVETSEGKQDANLSDHFGVRVRIPYY